MNNRIPRELLLTDEEAGGYSEPHPTEGEMWAGALLWTTAALIAPYVIIGFIVLEHLL